MNYQRFGRVTSSTQYNNTSIKPFLISQFQELEQIKEDRRHTLKDSITSINDNNLVQEEQEELEEHEHHIEVLKNEQAIKALRAKFNQAFKHQFLEENYNHWGQKLIGIVSLYKIRQIIKITKSFTPSEFQIIKWTLQQRFKRVAQFSQILSHDFFSFLYKIECQDELLEVSQLHKKIHGSFNSIQTLSKSLKSKKFPYSYLTKRQIEQTMRPNITLTQRDLFILLDISGIPYKIKNDEFEYDVQQLIKQLKSFKTVLKGQSSIRQQDLIFVAALKQIGDEIVWMKMDKKSLFQQYLNESQMISADGLQRLVRDLKLEDKIRIRLDHLIQFISFSKLKYDQEFEITKNLLIRKIYLHSQLFYNYLFQNTNSIEYMKVTQSQGIFKEEVDVMQFPYEFNKYINFPQDLYLKYKYNDFQTIQIIQTLPGFRGSLALIQTKQQVDIAYIFRNNQFQQLNFYNKFKKQQYNQVEYKNNQIFGKIYILLKKKKKQFGIKKVMTICSGFDSYTFSIEGNSYKSNQYPQSICCYKNLYQIPVPQTENKFIKTYIMACQKYQYIQDFICEFIQKHQDKRDDDYNNENNELSEGYFLSNKKKVRFLLITN